MVEVVNIQFAQPDLTLGTAASSGGFLDFTKNDIMRAVELVALFIGGLAVVFFVLRPLVSGLLSGPSSPATRSSGGERITAEGYSAGALPAPSDVGGSAASDLEHSIDVANVTGQVKASSMKKIAEMIDQHPDESVSILRTWLNESDQRAF